MYPFVTDKNIYSYVIFIVNIVEQ